MKITSVKPLTKSYSRLRMSPSKKKKGNLLCMWFGGVAVSWQPFFHDLHTKLYLTLLVCSVLTRTVRLLREHFGIMEMKLEFFTGIWNRQIAFIFRTKPAVEIFMIFFFITINAILGIAIAMKIPVKSDNIQQIAIVWAAAQ